MTVFVHGAETKRTMAATEGGGEGKRSKASPSVSREKKGEERRLR